MRKNQAGLCAKNLSNHTSLLLSPTPAMITSPLQSSNNNPQTSSLMIPNAPLRRQFSTPLMAATKLDNDGILSIDNLNNIHSNEDYINFKMPQNEIFKKLDGKIQKIVAAHSNYNKLYALNEFSSLGAGPKRPFELPPQLPPPPPWVPKVGTEFCGTTWTEEAIQRLNGQFPCSSSPASTSNDDHKHEINLSLPTESDDLRSPKKNHSLTIDSAISRLHQRRQQQQFDQSTPIKYHLKPHSSVRTYSNQSNMPTISPAQFTLLTQKIKETIEAQCTTRVQGGNLSQDDKKKFQENLVALLKEEISAVTRASKLKFTPSPIGKSKTVDQTSLILKSSPQTLYNTIRRETSLLLSKKDKSSVTQKNENRVFDRPLFNQNVNVYKQQATTRLHHTIKVIVPPTEFHPRIDTNVTNSSAQTNDAHSNDHPLLTYQVIKSKIRLFQESNQIILGKSQKSIGLAQKPKSKSTQKSLDKIVDRLQAKWSNTTSPKSEKNEVTSEKPSFRQQILQSSANLLQTARVIPMTSSPTPIPVFRSFSASTPASKNGLFYPSSGSHPSKFPNLRSKKTKRFHPFGLKIGNYLEKEYPPPNIEKLNIDQFAKYLNLVRSNDALFQRRQEQLSRSESRYKLPISNRPLRLRRLRGDGMHMPASASYKATRKVGLQ